MSEEQDIFKIQAPFQKLFVCTTCGTGCFFLVTNTHNSVPKPDGCPYNIPGTDSYDDEIIPNWKECNQRRQND